MKGLTQVFYFFICFPIFYSLAQASPHYGFNFSYPAIAKEPPDLSGGQFMLTYDPNTLHFRNLNIYFDGGYSHFRTTYEHHSITNIYSLAPVFRFYLRKYRFLCPYFEVSLGLSYLTHTRIQKRNLGIHFAFQDRIGVGSFVGRSEHVTIGFHAVHYSNAHFSTHNSGITVPLAIDIGYRF